MRIVSNEIKEVINSSYGRTTDVVIITIPEQISPPYPETVLYLANGEGIVIEGQLYSNYLRTVSSIKFSLGASADNAQIALQNVTKDLGIALVDTERFLDGAKVEIKKAFLLDDGTWEADTIFIGQISDTKIDQELVSISVSSELNRRGANVAGRTLTQRCIFVFNLNGSGVGPQCGWQTSQPGDPLFCDHTIDGEDGCRAHGNLHRVGAVPAFTGLSNDNGYGNNTGGGWGSGTGGGWCVHPATWVLCVNGQGFRYWSKALNLKEGDYIVSLDVFGKLVKSRITGVDVGTSEYLLNVTTKLGYNLSCSESHPLITSLNDLDQGTPLSELAVGAKVLSGHIKSSKPIEDEISNIEKIFYGKSVIRIQLSSPYHAFLSGSTKVGALWSHNVKDFPRIDIPVIV